MRTLLHKTGYGKLCLFLFITVMPAMALITSMALAETVIANDDFIILLDQSGSMREKTPGKPQLGYESAQPAKKHLTANKIKGTIDAINFVVDDKLRKGDCFTVITFGTKRLATEKGEHPKGPTVILSQQLRYDHEREVIKHTIGEILFKDKRTDIVAGLMEAKDLLNSLETPERRKILIMITDGVNDPDPKSPYFTEEAQKAAYKKLYEAIYHNKWNVFLIGLGEYTRKNIDNLAQKLELPSKNRMIVEHLDNSREITEKLKGIFNWAQTARVETEKKGIKIKLKPDLYGGYEKGEDSFTLESFYGGKVEIKLNTKLPIQITKTKDLQLIVTPLELELIPNQPKSIKIIFEFTGKRPEEGIIKGSYSFQFSEASTPFYPHDGSFEIILPSWWDSYGIYTLMAVVLVLLFLNILFWILRRSNIPEIQIEVTAKDQSLGEPMKLRIKESFTIANGYLEGRSVSAKGLNCKIAAKVKYLGRKKFEVEADEAKILDEGKECDRLRIGMDSYFDLKDKDGKTLALISISNPGKASDPFGDSYDDEPF